MRLVACFTWPIYTDLYYSSCSCWTFLEAKHCTALPFIGKSLYSHFYCVFIVNMAFAAVLV
jgi:hypothetical protein